MVRQRADVSRGEAARVVAADPDTVWRALTVDVDGWWPQTYHPHGVVEMEAMPGGRFWERFDDEGNGALYGVVSYVDPAARILRLRGPMGMPGAQLVAVRWEVAADPNGARWKASAWVDGTVPDGVGGGLTTAIQTYQGSLATFVETGARSRPR